MMLGASAIIILALNPKIVKEVGVLSLASQVAWDESRLTPRPNPHRTRDATRANWKVFSFDVACLQCGHPHSHQQVPFAFVALRIASRVLCGLGPTFYERRFSFWEIRREVS